MPAAYVLINAEVGSEEQVFNECMGVEFVKEAHIVYGVYDVIVRVEADTMAKLKNVITERVGKIDLVRSTLTMILVD